MPNELVERISEREGGIGNGYSVSLGIVSNNFDLLGEGRVQVRIPSLPAFDLWARVVGVGAGSSRGFFWIPELDDEVLVAFNQNDERDAYILGGVWSTFARPPVDTPVDSLTKRVIKTGKTSGFGHEVEFDDLLQSITITSSTNQKVSIDPLAIELSNSAGTLTIKMDNVSQTISINSVLRIEIAAPQVSVEGKGLLELKGGIINLKATGACNIQGAVVKIN